MPVKEFLEDYPLYRSCDVQNLPAYMHHLPKPAINLMCPVCASAQTFSMRNEYWEIAHVKNAATDGEIFRLLYRCTHCEDFERRFYVLLDGKQQTITKVGQYPPWEIKGDPRIEKLLGVHAPYFRRGLVCESQGYGIGAFGYYRRIVEETIGQLLDQVTELLAGEELTRYSAALEKVKKTTVTQEKIELVKDMLPATLRPDGMNPLAVLHSSLSDGLHAQSDEICLKQAGAIREILTFLVNQIAASREAQKSFTANMRKFLNKKS